MTHVDEERMAERLHSIALHLMRGVRRADDALGVGPARLSALSVLLSGPKTISELAEAEQVRLPTVTRIVSGLESMGLARRVPNPDDGRSVRVEMTHAGAETIAGGRALRVELLARTLRELDDEELLRIDAVLDVLERVSIAVLRRPFAPDR
jgi:DNA-binding MarR family transcriptional regulator